MAKEQETTAQPAPTENAGVQAQAQQAQARPCPQDCRMCGINQQVFCTTKMLFDLCRRQQVLETVMGEMSKALTDIQAQLHKDDEATELSIPFAE